MDQMHDPFKIDELKPTALIKKLQQARQFKKNSGTRYQRGKRESVSKCSETQSQDSAATSTGNSSTIQHLCFIPF